MSVVVISTDPYLTLLGEKDAGNPIGAPINFVASYEGVGLVIDLNWDPNPVNAGGETSYTITRAGQPPVVITPPTTTYQDNRDLTPDQIITWQITATTIDGTSNPRTTQFTVPVIIPYFRADLITTIVPEVAQGGAGVDNLNRGSGAYQTDQNLLLNFVAVNVPRHTGARLDPDGVTYYDTQDDGTTPIDPATLLGVLIERSDTNIYTYSDELITGWGFAGGISGTSQSTDSPLSVGTLFVDSGAGTNANQYVFQSAKLPDGVTTNISMFAEAGLNNWFYIWVDFLNAGTWFDLSTGLVGTDQNENSSIEALSNGWYRCSITATASGLDDRARFGYASNDGSFSASRNNDSSVWMVGVDSVPAYQTTHITSDSDTGSRAFEALKYPVAGNLPANDAEIQFQFTAFVHGLTDVILFESAIDASNYTRIEMQGSDLLFVKNIAGTPVEAKVLHTIAANTTYAIVAIQDSAAGMSVAIDGGVAGTNVDTANMPLGADFYVGGTTTQADGCFKLLRVAPS